MLPAWLASRTQLPALRYLTVAPLSEQALPVVEASTARVTVRLEEALGVSADEPTTFRCRGHKGDALRGLAHDDRPGELGGREVARVAGLVGVHHAVTGVEVLDGVAAQRAGAVGRRGVDGQQDQGSRRRSGRAPRAVVGARTRRR